MNGGESQLIRYTFYADNYAGSSINERDFHEYQKRASAYLDKIKRKFMVSSPNEDSESMAICAVADALYAFDMVANGSAGVQSTTVGSVSVSYTQTVDATPKGQAEELYRCVRQYLDIYRGVNP